MPFGGGVDSRGPKKPCIRWGPDPTRRKCILGVVRPIEKHWELLLRCTQPKKPITASARLLQPITLLPTGRCNINFLTWKIRPAMRTVVKFLWPLVYHAQLHLSFTLGLKLTSFTNLPHPVVSLLPQTAFTHYQPDRFFSARLLDFCF